MSDKVYYENKSINNNISNDEIKIIDKPFDRILLFSHDEKPTHLLKIDAKLLVYHLNGKALKKIVNNGSVFYEPDTKILEYTTAIRNVHVKSYNIQDFICTSGVLYVFYYTNNKPIAYFVNGNFKDMENKIGNFNRSDEINAKYKLVRYRYNLDDMEFK